MALAKFHIWLNPQFCPKNVGKTLILFLNKWPTIYLAQYQTFFCSKKVGKTSIFIFEQLTHTMLRDICSKIKIRVLWIFLGKNCGFS